MNTDDATTRPANVYLLGTAALLLFVLNLAVAVTRTAPEDTRTPTHVELIKEAPFPPVPPMTQMGFHPEKLRAELERARAEVERATHEVNRQRFTRAKVEIPRPSLSVRP
ncbi:MAG: hypothetical protein ACOCTG_04900 [Bacteroidota bacterium]